MVKDKKIIILAGLAVIMLFVWIRSCSIVLNRGRPKTQVSSKLSIGIAPKPQKVLESRVRPRSQYLEWGRSPFILPEAKEYGSGLILVGILWDRKNPRAIINNRIVGLGEELEGYKIIEIKKDRVILSDGINKIELRL